MSIPSGPDQHLCLRCGICCDGTLFHAVELQTRDRASRLAELGLPIRATAQGSRFPQPCRALEGCRCTVYPDRPSHCRKFDCLLLQQLQRGEITLSTALRWVRKARAEAASVGAGLDRLGGDDRRLSLRARFRRLAARLERNPPGRSQARDFADLGERMHRLNVLLSRRFYDRLPA